MKQVIAILLVLLTLSFAHSQPILTGKNYQGDLADFYIMTVDGEELEQVELTELYEWNIFEDLEKLNLTDGLHELTLRFGNEIEESEELRFFVLVTIFKDMVRYEIQPDPGNTDSSYLLKFGSNLVAEVDTDTGDVYIPPDTNDYTDSGGGGGGGCFINTL